jgi:hypothetical protein
MVEIKGGLNPPLITGVHKMCQTFQQYIAAVNDVYKQCGLVNRHPNEAFDEHYNHPDGRVEPYLSAYLFIVADINIPAGETVKACRTIRKLYPIFKGV